MPLFSDVEIQALGATYSMVVPNVNILSSRVLNLAKVSFSNHVKASRPNTDDATCNLFLLSMILSWVDAGCASSQSMGDTKIFYVPNNGAAVTADTTFDECKNVFLGAHQSITVLRTCNTLADYILKLARNNNKIWTWGVENGVPREYGIYGSPCFIHCRTEIVPPEARMALSTASESALHKVRQSSLINVSAIAAASRHYETGSSNGHSGRLAITY